MASDTNEILRGAAGADFVLLDETELHLPSAGDVVFVGDGALESFWQPSVAGESLPALDELISDHAAAPVSLLGAPGRAAPADVRLFDSAENMPAVSTPSLVDIVIDDGSNGPPVA